MNDLASTLECLVCGRWWIVAVGGPTNGECGSTLCPGCHVDCEKCGSPLTVDQLRARRSLGKTSPPACSRTCGVALMAAAR